MEASPYSSSSSQPGLVLKDPWEPEGGSILLDGSLERRRFPPWLMALIVLVFGFIIFQVLAAIATLAILLLQGASIDDLLNLEALMQDKTYVLLIGNTVGQFFGLALPVWLLVYLHTKRNLAFIRLRPTSGRYIGLSVLGLAALMPISWWLGSINANLPLPEWLEQLEASQVDLIEQVITQDLSVVFLLAMMAVTPAICEEIVFRGYLQRQFERSTNVAIGIILTGILFGLYHLRLTQALPLAAIGIYLAYITWRTGSLWPAIVVHFVNNAFSISLGKYLSSKPEYDLESLDHVEVPLGIVVGCAVVLGGIVYIMHRLVEERLADSAMDAPLTEENLRET